MSLIDSLAMLAMPGMSPPAALGRLQAFGVDGGRARPDVQPRESLADRRVVGTSRAPGEVDEELRRRWCARWASARRGLAAAAKSPTRRSSWPATWPGIAMAPPMPPPAPSPARSFASVVLATAQPPLRSPMIASSGTRASVEEHLVEHGVAGHLAQRPHLDAGLVHVDREPGDALVLRRVGIGAGEQHAHVGGLAQRGPHLLAVDDPLVAVADGPRREAGEVGAGARLAEELAPRPLARDDVADVGVDLLAGAVGRDRRRREQQPEPDGAPDGAERGDLAPARAPRRCGRGRGRSRPRAASAPTSRPCRVVPTTRRR